MIRWIALPGCVVLVASLFLTGPQHRPDFDRAFAWFVCSGNMCKDAKSIYSRKSAAWVALATEDACVTSCDMRAYEQETTRELGKRR